MVMLNKGINLSDDAFRLTEFYDGGSLFNIITEAIGIERIDGKKVVFVNDEKGEIRPINGWGFAMKLNTFKIPTDAGERNDLVAIDSSAIPIAETEEGGVYAVKAGAVEVISGRRSYRTLGPFIAYLGLSNINAVEEVLGSKLGYGVIIDKQSAMRLLRGIAESTLMKIELQELRSGIMLVDGSLKDSGVELGNLSLRRIVYSAPSGVKFIAISKGSSIKAIHSLYSGLLEDERIGVEITDLVRGLSKGEFGRKFLVKLEGRGLILRADLPEAVDPVSAFGSLIKSDALVNGYPESLKGAHILSIFLENEARSARTIVARRAGAVLAGENVRKVLLGGLKVIEK